LASEVLIPTLLAVTDNQTLLVGLTLRGTWRIETDDAALDGPPDAVLIDDDGSSRLGLALDRARQLGVRRVVVITNEADIDGVSVVRRPYQLDDLLAALADPQEPQGIPSSPVVAPPPPDLPSPPPQIPSGLALEPVAEPQPPPAAGRPPVPEEAASLALDVAKARHALDDVNRLLDRLPLLASVRYVAEALIEEVVDLTAADMVVVYRLERDDAYRVVASSGLTGAEGRTSVPATHPLVANLEQTGGTLLLDGAGRSLVAGWAASRAPAFIAVPAGSGDPPRVVLLVGASSLDQDDLEVVAEAATHASSGLELSMHLADLADRIATLARS
jgi:hypothetical protein